MPSIYIAMRHTALAQLLTRHVFLDAERVTIFRSAGTSQKGAV